MFRLFGRKKKKKLSNKSSVCNYSDMKNSDYVSKSQFINNFDDKIVRLMELINYAIDAWTVEYHLENLPKKIIFEQALDVMQIIETSMNNNES